MYFFQHVLLYVFVSSDALIDGFAAVALTYRRGDLRPSLSPIHCTGELQKSVFESNLLILRFKI
jgi:hypothetical protein